MSGVRMCKLSLRSKPLLTGEQQVLQRSGRSAHTLLRSSFRSSWQQEEPPNRDTALPNGVWWLDKASNCHDVLYGSNFVVQRPKLGGEGLIPYQGLTAIQLMPEPPQVSRTRLKALPAGESGYFDVVDYRLVEPQDKPMQQLQLPAPYEPQAPGLVLWRPPDIAQDEQVPASSDDLGAINPRRTKAVRFTCKRCGTVSTKLVNPHVWATGSVFARCEGCSVIHKLKDNLNVFHEVGGRGSLDYDPETVQIPAGLPQRPNRDIKVSGFEQAV